MILLVDVGNTRIKWAMAHGDILSEQGAISHQLGAENNFQQLAILDQHWFELGIPERVVIANGAGAMQMQHIESWVKQHWLCPVSYLTTPKIQLGVTNAYARHQDLGIDRWLGLLAGHHLVDSAVCIIDCGTAVTVDAIDVNGQHLGGCIVAGLAMMRNALNQTGKINVQPVRAENALSAVNASTKTAIYCGTLYAVSKAVDAIIIDMKNVLASDVSCIITGGDAKLIQPLLCESTVYEKDWLFRGMVVSVNQ